MQKKLLVFAVIYGATLLVVILALSFSRPDMPDKLFLVVRTTLAVAAAGFGGALAGSFRIEGKIAQLSVTATGALALGILVYRVNPLPLPDSPPDPSGETRGGTASPEIHNQDGTTTVEYGNVKVIYEPRQALSDQEIQQIIASHPDDWKEVLQARLDSERIDVIASPKIVNKDGTTDVRYGNIEAKTRPR